MNLWIVVGDAAGVRLLASGGRSQRLRLIRRLMHDRSRVKASEINTDRPGRNRHGPASNGMYAMASSVRVKDVEAQQFAREVAGVLGSALDRREFDSVALVAPARFLGVLTESLDSQVRKRLLIRVDKDLSHVEERLLADHLPEVFAAAEEEEHRRIWSK